MKFAWLANKNSTPRMPGQRAAHRAAQVSGSGYAGKTLKQLFEGMKLPKPKAIKIKFK